ncbi:TIGR02530 family flagellar biosynthesis protein [Wansuia hejianensis]|uniref:Flagellar operon protein n=1 Tax=Wansuia hejianensis TaxID=2763667 RepID=A0A926EZB4_9FIRM|nr:TIGR02530 family flagellar biosynthesis protein [Wansuia hejianensis]MBC8590297.1 hypothetical protein [Wansuia hejianensis]
MSFKIERGHILPSHNSRVNIEKNNSNIDFKDVLQQTIKGKEKIKISGHAQQRMLERNIRLQPMDIHRIEEAMEDLEKKGAKESLMIYKDMAIIASINNRTIITAMGKEDVDIVTNIDSTMIIK